MMPYNYPSILFPKHQSAGEKLFFGTIKELKLPSNKLRVWRSSFFRIPTAAELERMLANRGDKLSKNIESVSSLRKAAECFLQAAALCDISGIKEHYKETAEVLTEMAGNLQAARTGEKNAHAALYDAQTHLEDVRKFVASPKIEYAKAALGAADSFSKSSNLYLGLGLEKRARSSLENRAEALSAAIKLFKFLGMQEDAQNCVQLLTEAANKPTLFQPLKP